MIEHRLLYLEHLEMFRGKHKSHDYYTTAQIIKITGTSERTVRYRISKLKKN
jgi:Fic family protein